jgi:hypothetical protein
MHKVIIESADIRAADWTIRWLTKLQNALPDDSLTSATCGKAIECLQDVLSAGPEFVIKGGAAETLALPMEGNPIA